MHTALQIDFARHSLEGVKVINNLQDGLGILYSDIYSADAVNTVRNSDFSNNRGSGISFKQLGLRISSSRLENNKIAGIRHNPALSAVQQREFAGWFISSPDTSLDSSYDPVMVPGHSSDVELSMGETKYLVTSKVNGEAIDRYHHIRVSLASALFCLLLSFNLDDSLADNGHLTYDRGPMSGLLSFALAADRRNHTTTIIHNPIY
jgi:hypothetical protein